VENQEARANQPKFEPSLQYSGKGWSVMDLFHLALMAGLLEVVSCGLSGRPRLGEYTYRALARDIRESGCALDANAR
jgi:hypothetical protein